MRVRDDSLASPMTIPDSSGSVAAGIHYSKSFNQASGTISDPNFYKLAFEHQTGAYSGLSVVRGA